jgi:hypothetical protein
MSEIKQVRKRGRPRKNTVQKKQENKPISQVKEEDEIILRLRLCSDDEHSDSNSESESELELDNDENDFFTINETTDGNKAIDYISDSSNSSVESLKLDDLYKELKIKEKLVKQLTEKVNYLNMYGSVHNNTATKDIMRRIHDLKLIKVNGGASITIPDKTNIKCWNCTHNFDGPPCFIPDNFINGFFYVFGCFCSFNCAATYNLEILNDSRSKTRYSFILLLFHKIFGKNQSLNYAPKKEMLEDYGGEMTIKEYRDSFLSMGKEHKISIPPMIPLLYEIETRGRDAVETTIEYSSN